MKEQSVCMHTHMHIGPHMHVHMDSKQGLAKLGRRSEIKWAEVAAQLEWLRESWWVLTCGSLTYGTSGIILAPRRKLTFP